MGITFLLFLLAIYVLIPMFLLVVYLLIPIIVAIKASGEGVWPLLQYLGAYCGGVFVAGVATCLVGLLLPKPSGPPQQMAEQTVVLRFVVFPVLSLAFGTIGLYLVAWRRK